MEVIPVIELRSGKCMRRTYTRGDQPNVQRDDALDIALRWKNEGARRIYLHDVDATRIGMPQNHECVREICRRSGLPVIYNGGVRSVQIIERVFSWGAQHVVADAETSLDLAIRDFLVRYADRVSLELRAFGEQMPMPGAPAGAWQDVYDYLRYMNQTIGWPAFVYRPIFGDGVLAPPIREDVAKFVQQARKPVTIYSKVTCADDFNMLLQSGVDAALVCEALYDNTLKLPELLLTARRAASGTLPQTAPTAKQPPSAPLPPGQRPSMAPPRSGVLPPPGYRPMPGSRPPAPRNPSPQWPPRPEDKP